MNDTQTKRRLYLIRALLDEQEQYADIPIPKSGQEQKKLLRSLMNLRPPRRASDEFLAVQGDYLQEEIAAKGITDVKTLLPVEDGIYLWQGDITTLRCDAIVNAANSGMTGCYHPCHACIDNAIHTFAGVQLRLECAGIMERQGFPEPVGQAKITNAYHLPCQYILHTVGPVVSGQVTQAEENLLASCYRSCLELAKEKRLESVAFCCISTGEFHFPNERAAEIAIQTVQRHKGNLEVVFNVFRDCDFEIYRNLLGKY